MAKTTTIDHTSVLEMALVGYQMQRSRIEAAIAEIQAELGVGGSRRSKAAGAPEPAIPRQAPVQRSGQETHGCGSEEALGGAEGEEGPGEASAACGLCKATKSHCKAKPEEAAGPDESSCEEGCSQSQGEGC